MRPQKIISIYRKENRSEKKKNGRVSNRKITTDVENFIESEIKRNRQITLEEIKNGINRTFTILVSLEPIRRVIYRLNITVNLLYFSFSVLFAFYNFRKNCYFSSFTNLFFYTFSFPYFSEIFDIFF